MLGFVSMCSHPDVLGFVSMCSHPDVLGFVSMCSQLDNAWHVYVPSQFALCVGFCDVFFKHEYVVNLHCVLSFVMC